MKLNVCGGWYVFSLCSALHRAEQSLSATSSSSHRDRRRPRRAVSSAWRAVSAVCSVVSSPDVRARSSSTVSGERSFHVTSGVIRDWPAITRQVLCQKRQITVLPLTFSDILITDIENTLFASCVPIEYLVRLSSVCYRHVPGGYQYAVMTSCRCSDDVSTHLLATRGRCQSATDAGYLSPQPSAAVAASQPLSGRDDSVSATSELNLWGSTESDDDNVFELTTSTILWSVQFGAFHRHRHHFGYCGPRHCYDTVRRAIAEYDMATNGFAMATMCTDYTNISRYIWPHSILHRVF